MTLLACALSLALQLPPGTEVTTSEPVLDLAEFSQGTVAALAQGDQSFTARSLGVGGQVPTLDTPFIRTEAWDTQGQLIWSREVYSDLDANSASSALLARDLVYDPNTDLVVQGRAIDHALVVEALNAGDGSVAWTSQLGANEPGLGDSIRRLAFDSQQGQVLAIVLENSTFRIYALDGATGLEVWSTELAPSLGAVAQDPEFDLSEATNKLFIASKSGSEFLPVRVHSVDTLTGSVTLLNEQYSSHFASLAVDPAGERVALALGRQPSARLAMLNATSGAVEWFFKDEATSFDDFPVVTFEPDGENLLVGFMRRGIQSGPFTVEDSGARFLRFQSAGGQLLWSVEQAGGSVPIVGTASGPQLIGVGPDSHIRSFTLTDSAGKHVQHIERVRNVNGTVIQGLTEDGLGNGGLHLAELGQDSNGDQVAVIQLQQAMQAPSLSQPVLAQARWSFASGTFQVTPFDSVGLEGSSPVASDFEDVSRLAALVTTGAVSDQLQLSVVSADTGKIVAQATFDKPYLDAGALVRLSEGGQYAAVRTISNLFLGGLTDHLWVVDLSTGNLAWERQLPRGSDPMPPFPGSDENGRSSLEIADGRVLVSDAVPQSNPVQHRLHCLDLNTGATQWSRDLGCYGVLQATLAVDAPSVYAVGDLDLGPTSAPTILELDLLDGSTVAQIPLPAEQCVLGISTQEASVAVLTRDPQASVPSLSRAWAFDRGSLALIDTQAGNFIGLEPLAPHLGFAVVDVTGIQQLGLQSQGPGSTAPWFIEAPYTVPNTVLSIDGGDTLIRAVAQLDSGLTLTAWDAGTAKELWREDLFLPDAATLNLTASSQGELHAWAQSATDLPQVSGAAFAHELLTYIFPDVLISPGELSVLSGGQASLDLRGELGGTPSNESLYVVFGGSASIVNGPLIGGFQLPFDPLDPFLQASLTPQPGTFIDFSGTLNDSGNATAHVSIPSGLDPALAGEDFYFAFAQFEFVQGPFGFSTYELTHISGAAPLSLVP